MTWERTYSDEQLVNAIAAATSWRGLLRALGLNGTSSSAMRSVRSNADRLGVDYGHFRGQRRWTEAHLRAAIAASTTWADAADHRGLQGASAVSMVKGHAARLGLDVNHLTVPPAAVTPSEMHPDIAHLDRAGSLLAAAWFTMCGRDISWPLEPSRYDLLVGTAAGIRRVQVKTTVRVGVTWKAYLSTSRRERRTYDPDELDDFFVIDGDIAYYLIPVAAVGGLHAIHLRNYDQFRLTQVP
jgi:hypothetical protein